MTFPLPDSDSDLNSDSDSKPYGYIVLCRTCFHRGWGYLPQCMLWYHPPRSRPPRNRHSPPEQASPQSRPSLGLCSACWEIRSTSGRYESYWNANLFSYVPGPVVLCGLVTLVTSTRGPPCCARGAGGWWVGEIFQPFTNYIQFGY